MWNWLQSILGGGAMPVDPGMGMSPAAFGGVGMPGISDDTGGTGIGGGPPPPLGASLEPVQEPPVPLPTPKPDVGTTGGGAMAQAAGGQAMGRVNPLLEALKGVKAPPPPDVVKPSTPAAPRLTPIKGGQDLIQMLMALGASSPQNRQKYAAPGGGLPGGLMRRG
jgi:hypothetical protein